MWIESVKRRIHSNHLEATMDLLEASGLITELTTLIRKAKILNPTANPKDFLQVQKILTEELWNEHKKPEPKFESKPEEIQNSSRSRITKSLSITNLRHLTSTSKISTPLSSKRTFEPLNTSTQKYKLQVSQDVAYMSTFSFPKGCATFYKTRRLTSEKIPEVPGPGAYFCDPKMIALNNSACFGFNPNSTRSSRRVSLSLGKVLA